MNHDDVLEQLELAAVEPRGLERLTAGDTATSAAVIGHLAGCDACSEELRRLRRAAPLLRDVVRTTPSPELRERTLAYVRAHGRERTMSVPIAGDAVAASAPAPAAPVLATPERPILARPWTARLMPWVATAVAVVALAVASMSFLASRDAADRTADQARAIIGLEAVNRATLELMSEPDVRRVALGSPGGGETAGTLIFSPSTTKLVVVATGLGRPPEGQEYRCWVEIAGERVNVGRMFFADELAFWVGDTPGVSDVADGADFGVSLTEVGGASLGGDPVIYGEL
jgi:hypothetical protein